MFAQSFLWPSVVVFHIWGRPAQVPQNVVSKTLTWLLKKSKGEHVGEVKLAAGVPHHVGWGLFILMSLGIFDRGKKKTWTVTSVQSTGGGDQPRERLQGGCHGEETGLTRVDSSADLVESVSVGIVLTHVIHTTSLVSSHQCVTVGSIVSRNIVRLDVKCAQLVLVEIRRHGTSRTCMGGDLSWLSASIPPARPQFKARPREPNLPCCRSPCGYPR